MDTQIGVSGLTVTLGTRRYAVLHPWQRVKLGHVSQHAVDSTGRVYVYQRTGAPVQVLSPEGEALASWGTGEIADPHGIFITPDDRIFMTDRDAHQILVYDTDGRQRAAYGERHHARFGAPFNHPTDVAVAANGDFYVSDGYGNAHVHWFGADGKHRKTWGGIGTAPGLFSTPHGIWVTLDNKVLVGDRENNRIQVFTADGTYLSEWGDLYHPMDIWGDADGTIYVTDQAPRIVAFTPTGETLGRCKVVATHSHGLWGDAAGNLYCSEHNGQLTKLARLS
jgi:peptidylglycine monooxygenase